MLSMCKLTRYDGAIPPPSDLANSKKQSSQGLVPGNHRLDYSPKAPELVELAISRLFTLPCLAFLEETPIKALA